MISIKDFQKKYKHHINKDLSYSGLYLLRKGANFDFDVYLPSKGMNLQRGLVWTLEQKRSLILTILRDQKINSVVVIQHKDNVSNYLDKYNWQVIDGKQRLTTIFDYFDDKFSIVVNDKEYLYSDLPKDCQGQINRYDLRVDVHYSYYNDPISDDTKIDLFEEINWLGTPQDIQHLQNLKNGQIS